MNDPAGTVVDPPSFVSYGPSHGCVLVFFAAACFVLVAIGRRWRGTRELRWFRRCFAATVLAVMFPMTAYLWLPSQWDVRISLPFDLCDLAWMAAVYTLWTGRASPVYGALYYWGLSLTTQGLVTPDLQQDFPHIFFIMFFASHCLTPAAAIFLTWGVGLRPTWKLMWTTAAATIVWGTCMLVFNAVAGTNYMYLNAKPLSASLLDFLGPWPIYLGGELAVGIAMWTLLTLPWYLGRDKRIAIG
jgi:hypothetical integral membrane protein (TIGR02206 family)